MTRLFILALCNLSIRYADLSSSNIFFSGLLPFINFCFIVYLLWIPFIFLFEKGLVGEYGRTDDSRKLLFIVTAFCRDIRSKYDGKFSAMGALAFPCEILAFIMELALVAFAILGYYVMIISEIAQ